MSSFLEVIILFFLNWSEIHITKYIILELTLTVMYIVTISCNHFLPSPWEKILYPNCTHSPFPLPSSISLGQSGFLLLWGPGKFSQYVVLCVLLKRTARLMTSLSLLPSSPFPHTTPLIDSCLRQKVLTCFSNQWLSWWALLGLPNPFIL